MKTKTITLYNLDELSKEAQEKAHAKWREGNDYMFIEDCMADRLHELLEENNITDTNDTSKPGTKPTQVLYSLSHSQGDGACFEGVFEWKNYTVHIKHSGRYVHSNSVDIIIMNSEGEGVDDYGNQFKNIYQKICSDLEQYGYDFIEHEDSFEAFQEACEANEYTFRENGIMEN